MVIVPGHVDDALLSCLSEQLSFFLTLRVLPGVLSKKKSASMFTSKRCSRAISYWTRSSVNSLACDKRQITCTLTDDRRLVH